MNNDSYTPWFNKNDTNERNERAKKAYTALLTVTAMTPENHEYEQFSKEVKFNFSSATTLFYSRVIRKDRGVKFFVGRMSPQTGKPFSAIRYKIYVF